MLFGTHRRRWILNPGHPIKSLIRFACHELLAVLRVCGSRLIGCRTGRTFSGLPVTEALQSMTPHILS
jgi:hypothetical protein